MAYYNAGFYNTGAYPYPVMNQYGYGHQQGGSLDNSFLSLFSPSRSYLPQSGYPQPQYSPQPFWSQPSPVSMCPSRSARTSDFDLNRSLFDKEMVSLDKRNNYFSNYYNSASAAGVTSAFCGDMMNPKLAAAILKDNFDLLDTALGGEKNGIFTKKGLEAIASKNKNKGLPQNLKDAAQYLLDNEAVYNAIDSAKTGNVDGDISFAGLGEYLGEEKKMTAKEAAIIIRDNIRTVDTADAGKQDNKFGKNDLEKIVQDKDANEDLRKAAQFYLDNQSAFNILDSAKNGKHDGKVTLDDVNKAIDCDLLKSFA